MTEPNLATPEVQPEARPAADASLAADASPAAETASAVDASRAADASPATQSGAPEQQPATAAQPGATTGAPTTATRRALALTALRRHWLFSALLAAGLVMRVLARSPTTPR